MTVIAFATIVLFTGPGEIWLKTVGAGGALLCAEALWYLNSIYNAGERYKPVFWEAHLRLEVAKNPESTEQSSRGDFENRAEGGSIPGAPQG